MQKLAIFISSFAMAIADIYVLSKFDNKKISLSQNIFCHILLTLILFFNTAYNTSYLKSLIVLLSFYFIKNKFFMSKTSISIVSAFFVEILSILGEVFMCLVIYVFFKNIDMNSWSQTFFGILTCNFITLFFMVIFANISFVKKIYLLLESITNNFGKYKLTFLIISAFSLIALLFNIVYFKYSENHLLLYFVVLIIFAFYTFIIFMIIYYYSRYNKVARKYSLSLENLSEYEEIINKYRVLNHENKNNLLIIRNMGNYSKAKKYIDQLIENKEQENKQIYNIVKRIPSPYLRAVVYTKMNKMENNNINSQLVVGRNISSKLFLNLDSSLILDVCNIVNVFLDNAIDASMLSKKKNVLIDISKDDNLIITISNTFDGEVQINQINNIGYTSKGKGHGYGLVLVKDLINKNKNLENITEFENGVFTQMLIIKLN